MKIATFIIAGIVTFTELAYSQYCPQSERGSSADRHFTTLDTNRVQTTFLNVGYLGRTGAGQGIPMMWPTGTNRPYIALATMFVGGEVQNTIGDTLRIVSVPAFRQSPGGISWNFEPVSQYRNPASPEFARSDDSTTWPPFWPDKMNDSTDPGWPGSWNGLLGKNVFIRGVEVYHHYSDDLYSRYPFYPIPTDTARRGLGIVVSHRTLQWDEPLLEDALILVSDIWNVGVGDIQRAAITLWVADFVGGDGDSQDDRPTYDLVRRLVYFNDGDGYSSFPPFHGVRVGTPTLVFMETPDDHGITNLQYLPAGSINFSTTPDIFFWNTFMQPGSYFDPNTIGIGEYDLFASCGFFSIPACSSRRLITAWVFSEDSTEGRRKSQYVKSFVAAGYSSDGVSVSILAPQPGDSVSGMVDIQWNADSGRQSLLVDIVYSSDAGVNWRPVVVGTQNDGQYSWNTTGLGGDSTYMLQVVAYDSISIGFRRMAGTFILTNPPVSIQQTMGKPARFALLQNYPNPFNPTTTIQFEVPVTERVNLRVFNQLGQLVKTLVDQNLYPGVYQVRLGVADLASGVYYYQMRAGSFIETKKLLLLR